MMWPMLSCSDGINQTHTAQIRQDLLHADVPRGTVQATSNGGQTAMHAAALQFMHSPCNICFAWHAPSSNVKHLDAGLPRTADYLPKCAATAKRPQQRGMAFHHHVLNMFHWTLLKLNNMLCTKQPDQPCSCKPPGDSTLVYVLEAHFALIC